MTGFPRTDIHWRMRRSLLSRSLFIVLGLSLLAWPWAMGRAEAMSMAAHGHGHSHQTDDAPGHSHQHQGECCDLCVVACIGWGSAPVLPTVVRSGDVVRYRSPVLFRLTPTAWSADLKLPPPLGPPSFFA
ncbi:MAG: DUF2946 family protein [Gemmatimonadota bacterium]